VLYTIYGLSLESDCNLPGLVPLHGAHVPDIRVRLRSVEGILPNGGGNDRIWYQSDWCDPTTGEPGLTIHRSSSSGAFHCRFPDGVRFEVGAAGDWVIGRISPTSTLADVSGYFSGPVLGFLLRLRGVVSLHASAVQVGSGAIALVGDPGAGKSTTAAMFAQLGFPVITEDVAALSVAEQGVNVRPGCSEIGLWPDAVELLYGSADALPKFSEGWEKRRLDLASTGAFAAHDVPLRAVYVLSGRGTTTDGRIAPLTPGDAMAHLIGNIYGNRLLHEEMRVSELDLVHRLVSSLPVKMATASADGRELGRFCEMILDSAA
jgi:hypothetical protein